MEMPTEIINYEIKSKNVNTIISIPNLKKEFTENFLALIAVKAYLEKKGIEIKEGS